MKKIEQSEFLSQCRGYTINKKILNRIDSKYGYLFNHDSHSNNNGRENDMPHYSRAEELIIREEHELVSCCTDNVDFIINEIRNQYGSTTADMIRYLYIGGNKTYETASKFNCSAATVHRYIEKAINGVCV